MAAAALCGLAAAVHAASQWQGGMLADAEPAGGERPRGSTFMVLDTGGSGGMFGQGDIRQNLLDVAFWTDGRRGVTCGPAGAFCTRDGGLTWTRVRKRLRDDYPDDPGITYYQVEMSGPDEFWLAEGKHPSSGRHLWHSTDAGATWEDVAPRFPGPFKSIWDLVARGRHIWVLGGWAPEASYASDDGGTTWRRLQLPEGLEPFHGVTPANAARDELKTIYLSGARRDDDGRRRPELWRSDDAGAAWARLHLPADATNRWQLARGGIALATREHGMIGLPAEDLRVPRHGVMEAAPGARASVIVTSDGGATWTQRFLPDGELNVRALWQDPTDPNHAFVAVSNGFVAQNGMPRLGPALYETRDAGRAWIVVLRGHPQINAITGLDRRRVWAVGNYEGFAANDVVAILAEPGEERETVE